MNQDLMILVVEDEPEQRTLIANLLQASDYQVIEANSVEDAIVKLQKYPIDIILSDWKLGDLSGIDLLQFVRKNYPLLGFVIATAYGTISHAVEALQKGADDYLAKPFQRQELLLTIEKAIKANLLRKKNNQLSSMLSDQHQMIGLVGNAPCMQKVFNRIARVSATNATVLILGESGTGKELAARALHNNSTRANQAFVAINCGAIAESIAEAELFGAEKGAYTGAHITKIGKFEAANEGTIFLDEIGELPLSLQASLLRFLQEGIITRLGASKETKLDVRVIAATHRDLAEDVKSGRFREDLFYRLNIIPLQMPALRERQEDIITLLDHFLQLHSKRHQCSANKISKHIIRQLLDYHWPGNVRELSNRVERYVLLDDEHELVSGLTQLNQTTSSQGLPEVNFPEHGFCWESFEKHCLSQALIASQGNKTKAANYLNLSYKAFLYRLEKYQISG